MIDMSNVEQDKEKLKQNDKSLFARVTKSDEKGVKIKIDGETNQREKYYNSLYQAVEGDRVYINYVSGTIIVIGKLMY